MTLSDLKNLDPEEANTDGRNANNGAGKEEQYNQQEDDIIDWKDLCRLDEDPVHRVEDLNVTEDVAASALADRILCLVDKGQEHGDPNEDSNKHQQETPEQLDRTKDCFDFRPCLYQPALALSTGFSCQALTANQSPFFPDKRVQLSAILWW